MKEAAQRLKKQSLLGALKMKKYLFIAILALSTAQAGDFKCEVTLQEGTAKEKTVQLEDTRGALLGNIDNFAYSAQVAPDNADVIRVTILDQSQGRVASAVHAPLPTKTAPVQVEAFSLGVKASVYCTVN